MIAKITLSKKQMNLIENEVAETIAASKKGIPGLLMAQISTINGDMYVGFVEQKKAIEIQKIQGVPIGKCSAV